MLANNYFPFVQFNLFKSEEPVSLWSTNNFTLLRRLKIVILRFGFFLVKPHWLMHMHSVLKTVPSIVAKSSRVSMLKAAFNETENIRGNSLVLFSLFLFPCAACFPVCLFICSTS